MPSGNYGSSNLTNKEKAAKEAKSTTTAATDSPSVTPAAGNSTVTNASGTVSNAEIAADPYGKNTPGGSGLTASFRQRGDSMQKRVGLDTRVRGDENSGTAGAAGSTVGTMQDAMAPDQSQGTAQQVMQQGVPQNASWEATRQPVDLQSVRGSLMSFLSTPQQGK